MPQVFNFEKHQVRVVTRDEGQTWFVAKDVAVALGYKKSENAITRHCKHKTTTPKRGGGKLTLIPESDLYRLTFGSKLKSADKFVDWVVEDVLPKIRQTGYYAYQQPPQLDNPQIKLARKTINDFIKDYGIQHAPKGQLINSRRALMQVHSFIRQYFNIGSYKNLNVEELESLTQALNDNAKTIFASVKDLFVVDLKDNNAITQSGNFIRIKDESGSIYGYSLDYILGLVNQEKNAKHSQDSDKPLEAAKTSNVKIPHHLETILNTVQSVLINCHHQIDMVKSGQPHLEIEQSIRIIRGIAPSFKMCTTNIEMVAQSLFVEHCKASKNTSVKEVLDNIAYSIL